jgi:hypothetical protein
MKRMQMLVLCASLAAVFAVGIGNATASALPTYFECAKGPVGSGIYADKLCTEEAPPGTGKWELQEGIGKGKPFKGKAPALFLDIPAIAGHLTCKTAKEEGRLGSPTSEKEVVITFSTCEFGAGDGCTSPGEPYRTIQTTALEGSFGYISKSPLKVGVVLSPETGSQIAEWSCEGLEMQEVGAIIFQRKFDVNTFSKSWEDVSTVTGEGLQLNTHFEGGPNEIPYTVVNHSGPFETGVQATVVSTGELLNLMA